MRVCQNILEIIGQTPIVKLNKTVRDCPAAIYAKLEMFNPSGSIRPGCFGDDRGCRKERPNQTGPDHYRTYQRKSGIGLAMVGAVKGYRVLVVMRTA